MMRNNFVLAVIIMVIAGCGHQPESTSRPASRTIALTFDDATLGDGPFFTGDERTRVLVDELAKAGVEEAMFFVTTNNVAGAGEDGPRRIRTYAQAGHTLGNHSHSHQWLSRVDTDEYIDDLDRAMRGLRQYDNVKPYYRFPYLDEGRSIDKRDRLRAALRDRKLKNGYVTVDTYDWYLVSLAREAREAGSEFDVDDLRDLYVDVITRSTEFYDAMARETLGRSPHHVLLLHENDLAAMFVGDLVKQLERRGVAIVPATVAFEDPIASREPDTLYLGQGRNAALAHEAGGKPADLVSPTEDEAYLRRRFEREVTALPGARTP
ncbi:MAG: polysaccharide deacetylase family protein [Woeseiaceae bacterium]